ncbi:hypothetical protein EYF80_053534 [Liparis tanakae]|uniref:Uncharacterized protein n=1 Tax=Liparis tanakae TaxID=230148 RepID=A0A4Z2F4Z7_9TELE|nr:hypothetical protein EYF80_053534 [Liparis tanakae]
MATLRRQPRGRTAASRQDRGSCFSTASCPVFSGPYSDPEEEPPLRRRSSPLILKGSLSSFHSSISSSPHGSLSSLQGSDPCRRGSLPSLQGPLPGFMDSTSNLRGSTSRLKRRSLGSLDPSSPSPSLHGGTGSSSDDDGSWDTSSWSSGATCLLRTPVKKDSTEASGEKSSAIAVAEPEIIYQNLIFSHTAATTESVEACAPERSSTELRDDVGSLNESSSSLSTNAAASSSHQRDDKSEDRRKFSQFLNEVTCRVFKSNDGPSQLTNLRHCYPSSPPSPPITSSHPPLTPTTLWFSPTSSNLQTIKEFDSKDITSSIHQWSKTLPSCKVLEPGDVPRTEKREGHCTKIQTQPSTGRRYLETDIDSVRRLDELVANGALGNERIGKAPEKVMESGTERGNRTPREVNGNSGVEKGKERGKRKESLWQRGRRIEKGMEKETGREMPCWEKDRWRERGREKEKKIGPASYETPPQPTSSGRSDACPVFRWPEGFPRMSYRSTSLPRPAEERLPPAALSTMTVINGRTSTNVQ